jgi:predicted DNA-binding transcriptional regulator AlpA
VSTTNPVKSDAPLLLEVISHRDTDEYSRAENKRLRELEKLIADGGRLIAPKGLAGAREVSAITGKEKTTITRWRNQGYLPEPIALLAQGPVWDLAEIVEFDRLHREQQDAAGRRPMAAAREPEPAAQ